MSVAVHASRSRRRACADGVASGKTRALYLLEMLASLRQSSWLVTHSPAKRANPGVRVFVLCERVRACVRACACVGHSALHASRPSQLELRPSCGGLMLWLLCAWSERCRGIDPLRAWCDMSVVGAGRADCWPVRARVTAPPLTSP